MPVHCHINLMIIIIIIIINTIIFFTLGIKDPEGFGKNRRKCVGVTITPGSPQTQRNHVAARR